MKPKAVIFDLDGTLCTLSDSSNPYNHDWEEVIIPEMLKIVEAMDYLGVYTQNTYTIILTGRKRKEYWEITEKWLQDNIVPYSELIMQEWNTARQNHTFKRDELIKLKERYDIIAVFDDNEAMKEVCKELGILLLHVNY